MPSDRNNLKTASPPESWHVMDDVVDEVATLAKAELTHREFYEALLEHAVPAISGIAGAVWLLDDQGRIRPCCRCNSSPGGIDPASGEPSAKYRMQLESVFKTSRPAVWDDDEDDDDGEREANIAVPSRLLQPVTVDHQTVGVLELVLPAGGTGLQKREATRFLAALAELADDFHRNWDWRRLRQRASSRDRMDRFIQAVHGSLDDESMALILANEGRVLVDCDRCSFAGAETTRFRIKAISGQDVIDRRANVVRCLERLIAAAVVRRELFWATTVERDTPVGVDGPLKDYFEASNSQAIVIVPLLDPTAECPEGQPPRLLGAVACEWFETARSRASVEPRLTVLKQHGELSLSNVIEYQTLPFLSTLRHLRRVGDAFRRRHVSKMVCAAVLCLAAVLAGVFVPADFVVKGRAKLQPKTRQEVFASNDGIVSDLRVAYGQHVDRGAIVAVLGNSRLDFESTRIAGEIQTTRRRLATVRAARLAMTPGDKETTNRYNELTAEEEELKEQLDALKKQEAVLAKQREELIIRSPVSGEVLTWDVHRLLSDRPVQRGHFLLTIADCNDEWTLEIQVPDDQVDYLQSARKSQADPLPVTFILETDPARTHHGTVAKIGMATETTETRDAVVHVTAKIDAKTIHGLRPGATAIAKVSCGRKPIGYVWFCDLFNAVKKRILF